MDKVDRDDPNARAYRWIYWRYKPMMEETGQVWSFLHQPRLDWQMWFLALDFHGLTQKALPHLLLSRLLHNSQDVWALLETNLNLKYSDTDWPMAMKYAAFHNRYTGPFNLWRDEVEWNNFDTTVAKMDNPNRVWYSKIFKNECHQFTLVNPKKLLRPHPDPKISL